MSLRIADLFCGAGGAGTGLHKAGFEVIGFDIEPQPNYPFEFYQTDALHVDLAGFDAVWASPPCQAYSIMKHLPWVARREHPRLIAPTRSHIEQFRIPYIIENVMNAVWTGDLAGGWLCGGMFGLDFYRHRAFETNWFWLAPAHPNHQRVISPGRLLGNRERSTQSAMKLDWMTKAEQAQAIPPAYSEFLGTELLRQHGTVPSHKAVKA